MNQPLRKYRLASARSPGSAPRAQRQVVSTCDLAPCPHSSFKKSRRGRAGIVASFHLNPSR